MKQMKDIFSCNAWKLDLFSAIFFSITFGYIIQIEADSGEVHYPKIALSIITALSSYILIYSCAYFFGLSIFKMPSWIWVGVGGSVLFAFARHILTFAVANWKSSSDPFLGFLSESLPRMIWGFFVGSIIYSCIVLFLMFMSRMLTYFLSYLINQRIGLQTLKY